MQRKSSTHAGMMLRAFLVAATMLGVVGGCRRVATAADIEGVPAVAFERLTEDDIARFTHAMPAVIEHLESEGSRDEELKRSDDLTKVLAWQIDWVGDAPGIDSVFAANGVDWRFFRAMLWRLSVTALAVGLKDAERQTRAELATKRRGIAIALQKRLNQGRRIAVRVSKENLEIFGRHYRDVRDFFKIVQP